MPSLKYMYKNFAKPTRKHKSRRYLGKRKFVLISLKCSQYKAFSFETYINLNILNVQENVSLTNLILDT